jgi:hypothetical protein
MSWAVLLEVWSAGGLWVEALGLLERALQLHVLRIFSTVLQSEIVGSVGSCSVGGCCC